MGSDRVYSHDLSLVRNLFDCFLSSSFLENFRLNVKMSSNLVMIQAVVELDVKMMQKMDNLMSGALLLLKAGRTIYFDYNLLKTTMVKILMILLRFQFRLESKKIKLK